MRINSNGNVSYLKVWNGRGHGRNIDNTINYGTYHFYVAAYSMAEACRIINKACNVNINSSEIKNYYSNCWGNIMNSIIPTEPCLYIKSHDDILTRIYPISLR